MVYDLAVKVILKGSKGKLGNNMKKPRRQILKGLCAFYPGTSNVLRIWASVQTEVLQGQKVNTKIRCHKKSCLDLGDIFLHGCRVTPPQSFKMPFQMTGRLGSKALNSDPDSYSNPAFLICKTGSLMLLPRLLGQWNEQGGSHQLGIVARACSPSTGNVEEKGSRGQGHAHTL